MATINLFGNQPSVELLPITAGAVSPGLLDGLTFDFFVSTTGGGAGHTGAINDPWSLSFAAGGAGGSLTAGKKVAVRGGTYDNGSSTLTFSTTGAVGTGVDNLDSKILFMQYPGEKAIITGHACSSGVGDSFHFNCDYTWFADLEWSDNGWSAGRNVAPTFNDGLTLGASHCNGVKFIHCISHDFEVNYGDFNATVNSDKFEVYGCINYNAGVEQSQLGHNFYFHHSGSSSSVIFVDSCIVFNCFGLNCQLYSDADFINWITLQNNIWFGGGALSSGSNYSSASVLAGGATWSPQNVKLLSNYLYGPDIAGNLLKIGQTSSVSENNVEVGNNYMAGGSTPLRFLAPASPQNTLNVHDNFAQAADSKSLFSIQDAGTLSYQWSNNEWHHVSTSGFNGTSFSTFKTNTGLGGTDTQVDAKPSITKVFVIPTTRFHSGRGHVCFFNWANSSSVSVNLSSILTNGHNYAIYDARDLVNPILTGIYTGAAIGFPTTQANDPTPKGGFIATPLATAPFFNAFLVIQTS